MSSPTARSGFTLIEVLAATTLLAIVTALLLPVVRTAMKNTPSKAGSRRSLAALHVSKSSMAGRYRAPRREASAPR